MTLPLSGLVRRLPQEFGGFDRRRTLPSFVRKHEESRPQSSTGPDTQQGLHFDLQNISLQVSRQEVQLQKFQTELACLQAELTGLGASTRSGALPGQVAALEKKQAVLTEAIENQSQVYRRLQDAVTQACTAAQEAFETSITIPCRLLGATQAFDEQGQPVSLPEGQRLNLRFPSIEKNGITYLRSITFFYEKESAEIRLRVLQVPVSEGDRVYVAFDDLS